MRLHAVQRLLITFHEDRPWLSPWLKYRNQTIRQQARWIKCYSIALKPVLNHTFTKYQIKVSISRYRYLSRMPCWTCSLFISLLSQYIYDWIFYLLCYPELTGIDDHFWDILSFGLLCNSVWNWCLFTYELIATFSVSVVLAVIYSLDPGGFVWYEMLQK